MACRSLIMAIIAVNLSFPVRFGRDDGFDAPCFKPFPQGIGVIGLVRQDGAGVKVFQQGDRLPAFRPLAARQDKSDGQPQGITDRMDFTAKAAFGTSQRLILGRAVCRSRRTGVRSDYRAIH